MKRNSFTPLALFLSFSLLASMPAHASVSHSYAEIKSFMYDLAAKHPDTVKVFTLGDSDSGQLIEGLKIGNGATNNLVVGTHHGNEYGSTEVAKAFAESVAANPIQGQTLFVIPVLNIDGYNHNERRESVNGTTQDPNRDYPGPCGTEGPFHLKSTAALAAFVDKENIVASATLHTFYPAVVYPWGIPATGQDLVTPYQDTFVKLVDAAVQDSHYQTGNSTEVIYPATGCYEDYAYWKHGIWSILFELGNSHSPSDADVAQMQAENVNGMRHMFEISPVKRAENHGFTGRCDAMSLFLDRHDE